MSLEMRREFAMADKWTFNITPIKQFVESYVYQEDGLWVDPFAGKADYADITNDLNETRNTDYNVKARKFFTEFEDNEVDGGVIFDPPYSPRQIVEVYDSIGLEAQQDDVQAAFYSRLRDEMERVCAPGAVVLSFGWNSQGCGIGRGFKKEELLLVAHGGMHNDTICLAERYMNENLDSFGGGE